MEKELLDKITSAIRDGGVDPDAPPVSERAVPDIYYDGRYFYLPTSQGGWVSVDKASAYQELVRRGFNPKTAKDELQSEVSEMLLRIQTEHNVAYVGPLAGHKAGLYSMNAAQILVTTSPTLIAPRSGEFPTIRKLLENALGTEQLFYFYSWLKVSVEMYESEQWHPGQALALCGSVGAGKNLIRKLITRVLGGRVAFPHAFMTDRTIFSSDIFGAETLAIEDQQESIDLRARRAFGAAIKNITVNEDQRCERKHNEALTLCPLWRLIISLNDDPERMLVLPPLDDDIRDKIMLLEVAKHPMPMPTRTPKDKAAFWSALEAELPMLVYFVNDWQIPADIACDRFGVEAYQNPSLVSQLEELAPEMRLLGLCQDFLLDENRQSWEGSAAELEGELCAESSNCSSQARKLLAGSNTCGTYLGRLAKKCPGLVTRRVLTGHTIWKVFWKWYGKPEADRSERELARRRK